MCEIMNDTNDTNSQDAMKECLIVFDRAMTERLILDRKCGLSNKRINSDNYYQSFAIAAACAFVTV